MLPEEIQKLRKELGCTAKELAQTLGIDPKEVSGWESGELFPTKKHVQALSVLREKGPSAVVRLARGKPSAKPGTARLSDPSFWRVVRKLLEHPALFDEVSKVCEKYPDPADGA